jgi:phage baseplate assembly protein V
MLAELKRLIGNIANYGTITQTKSADGKSLARVKVGERETDFLPALSLVNSFFKIYSPLRVGEQVVVISPFGEASSGFIIRSIFNKSNKEPSWANDTTAGVEFEDGTVVTYDTKAKLLKIDCVKDIKLKAKNISIEADNTNFIGGSVTHDGTTIDKTHTHTQTAGDHYGSGATTPPPN